jgi:hypothetical protein
MILIGGTFIAVRFGRQMAACRLSHPRLAIFYACCFIGIMIISNIFGFGLFNLIILIIVFVL